MLIDRLDFTLRNRSAAYELRERAAGQIEAGSNNTIHVTYFNSIRLAIFANFQN